MKCPSCNETLLMTERNSIEIDYCPKCRGVWLDKGELDKMLQFAERSDAPINRDAQHAGHPKKNFYNAYPKKRKSFLGDLFDFD